jgi:hypothetical protein
MFEWFFGTVPKNYTIVTDLFYPHEAKSIKYIGPKPERVLKAMGGLLKSELRIQGADTYEDLFKWDISGDPIKFYVRWRARRKWDLRTTCFVSLLAQGEKRVKTGEGWVKVGFAPRFVTVVPYKTSVDKFLKHLYFQKYYMKTMRVYMKDMMRLMANFESALRSLYGIEQKSYEEEH